jgi:hypothetical protein
MYICYVEESRSLAANILNKQSRTDNKGFGRGVNNRST